VPPVGSGDCGGASFPGGPDNPGAPSCPGWPAGPGGPGGPRGETPHPQQAPPPPPPPPPYDRACRLRSLATTLNKCFLSYAYL